MTISDRQRLTGEQKRQIALAAFDEAAAEQRAIRERNNLPPVGPAPAGMKSAGGEFRRLLELLPIQDDPEYPDAGETYAAPDGGPYCATCIGARWVVRRSPGATVPVAQRCYDCADVQRAITRNDAAKRAGLSEREQTRTFATFRPQPGARQALSAAATWSATAARGHDGTIQPWLVITGERGSGKTHIALAAANVLLNDGFDVDWWQVPNLVDRARELAGAEAGSLYTFRQSLSTPRPLFLDEFGALSAESEHTTFAIERFIEPLLNDRYRAGQPTLFTLKGSTRDVREQISQSVGRRLEDVELCAVIPNLAPEYRPPDVADLLAKGESV